MSENSERKKQKRRVRFFGSLVGICNGFFGGGGGMVAVPLLASGLKMPQKTAHATAIFLILPLSAVSGLIYATFGAFPGKLGAFTAAGVVLGGFMGALLLKKVPEKLVFWIFTAAMALSGAYLLFG